MQVGVSLGICAPAGVAAASRPAIELVRPPMIGRSIATGRLVLLPVEVLGPKDWNIFIQWERNRVSIQGETGTEYTISPTDEGADLRAFLQVLRPGSVPLTAYSNSILVPHGSWNVTGHIIQSVPQVPPQPSVSGFFVEV